MSSYSKNIDKLFLTHIYKYYECDRFFETENLSTLFAKSCQIYSDDSLDITCYLN
jgi:hypothetical protein